MVRFPNFQRMILFYPSNQAVGIALTNIKRLIGAKGLINATLVNNARVMEVVLNAAGTRTTPKPVEEGPSVPIE